LAGGGGGFLSSFFTTTVEVTDFCGFGVTFGAVLTASLVAGLTIFGACFVAASFAVTFGGGFATIFGAGDAGSTFAAIAGAGGAWGSVEGSGAIGSGGLAVIRTVVGASGTSGVDALC